jgi:predicted RNase H-like HicB family nuclease
MRHTLRIEREADGRYFGVIDTLPGCMAYGASAQDAAKRTAILALEIVRDEIEHGERTIGDTFSLTIAA